MNRGRVTRELGEPPPRDRDFRRRFHLGPGPGAAVCRVEARPLAGGGP